MKHDKEEPRATRKRAEEADNDEATATATAIGRPPLRYSRDRLLEIARASRLAREEPVSFGKLLDVFVELGGPKRSPDPAFERDQSSEADAGEPSSADAKRSAQSHPAPPRKLAAFGRKRSELHRSFDQAESGGCARTEQTKATSLGGPVQVHRKPDDEAALSAKGTMRRSSAASQVVRWANQHRAYQPAPVAGGAHRTLARGRSLVAGPGEPQGRARGAPTARADSDEPLSLPSMRSAAHQEERPAQRRAASPPPPPIRRLTSVAGAPDLLNITIFSDTKTMEPGEPARQEPTTPLVDSRHPECAAPANRRSPNGAKSRSKRASGAARLDKSVPPLTRSKTSTEFSWHRRDGPGQGDQASTFHAGELFRLYRHEEGYGYFGPVETGLYQAFQPAFRPAAGQTVYFLDAVPPVKVAPSTGAKTTRERRSSATSLNPIAATFKAQVAALARETRADADAAEIATEPAERDSEPAKESAEEISGSKEAACSDAAAAARAKPSRLPRLVQRPAVGGQSVAAKPAQ